LHHLGKPVTARDLRNYRHITVRDTGTQRDRRSLIIEANQRWTVSHMATSIEALCAGYGFSWMPIERISRELADGRLKALPMRDGKERWIDLYLIIADPDFAGPGVKRLAEIIRQRVKTACTKLQAEQT
jgi:DNA-binding transcriptional LysR family regulator